MDEKVENFLAHYGVLGMHWGKRKNPDYQNNQIKRDRQLYGQRGAVRINNRLNKGENIALARGSEVTRRNKVLGRNKTAGKIGSYTGAVAGGAGAIVGVNALNRFAQSRSGALFVASIFGRNSTAQQIYINSRSVIGFIASPEMTKVVGAGGVAVGAILGNKAGRSINTRVIGGYDPNRK